MEIEKIETPVVKKEPVKKVDSIVKPKEIKEIVEELKIDTSSLQVDKNIK
jgi:iron only hydrogenase large subunit-like protein